MGTYSGTENNDTFKAFKERKGLFRKVWKTWRINGLGGNDNLTGGNKADEIFGDAGNDTLHGLNGNGTLLGNAGDDSLFGGNDNDRLYGGAGTDTLFGANGDDVLDGDNGPGLFGNDSLDGGSGDDRLLGRDGSDRLIGGSGDDVLNGYGPEWQLGTTGSDVEVDVLTGDVHRSRPGVQDAIDGADTFVLGDYSGDYYLGDGHAVITDFYWREGDKIQVHGNVRDYTLDRSSNVFGASTNDTQIFLNGDLIAIVQDTTNVVASLDFVSVGLI